MYLSGKYISMDVLRTCGNSFRLLKTKLVLTMTVHYTPYKQFYVLIATQNLLMTKRLRLHQCQKKEFQEIFSIVTKKQTVTHHLNIKQKIFHTYGI